MKIAVTSDIHLEFGDCDIPNTENADVLILSGDICVACDIGRPDPNNFMEGARSNRIRDFFQRVSRDYPHVVYVMGNHEHYHGDFSESADVIRQMLADHHLHNVYLLDKTSKEIDGYLFIGGTLWTDMNRGDPMTLHAASTMMNDFRGVRHKAKGKAGGIWKFIPEDTVIDHREMKAYIKTVIENRHAQNIQDRNVIVVGHHAPSHASVHEKYRHDTMMNGCYYSDLVEFILDRPEIVLWTHGHTHEDFDYMIGTTRVICNPRGYVGYEARADQWKPKIVEL
jgi:Icc-related predicted phosphoesterase